MSKLSRWSALNLFYFIFYAFVFFVSTPMSSILLSEAFGRGSVEPCSAPLKALLRWWWKDLSNGITHCDKCSEPGGSSHLPPAFWSMPLIHCRAAFPWHKSFGRCFIIWNGCSIDCLLMLLIVFPAVSTCACILNSTCFLFFDELPLWPETKMLTS